MRGRLIPLLPCTNHAQDVFLAGTLLFEILTGHDSPFAKPRDDKQPAGGGAAAAAAAAAAGRGRLRGAVAGAVDILDGVEKSPFGMAGGGARGGQLEESPQVGRCVIPLLVFFHPRASLISQCLISSAASRPPLLSVAA